jgi:hypothetical protein
MPIQSKNKGVPPAQLKGIQTTQEPSNGRTFAPALYSSENGVAKLRSFFWVELQKISKFGLPFHFDKDSSFL